MERKLYIEGFPYLTIVDEDGMPIEPVKLYPSWNEAKAALDTMRRPERNIEEEMMDCYQYGKRG